MSSQPNTDTGPTASVILECLKPVALNYSDFIADCIARALARPDTLPIIAGCSTVKSDLHPTGGYLLSCKKTVEVIDRNGSRYRVTVEQVQS